MKPSYFKTPRTLDEATFYSAGAAIEIPEKVETPMYDIVLYVLTVVAVGVVVYVW